MQRYADELGRASPLRAALPSFRPRDGQLRLAGEMMRNDEERALALLAALEDGFVGARA